MSGIKPIEVGNAYRRLHARGLTLAALARQLNVGRSALSQVLNRRRRGSVTWRKIERSGLLTPEEIRMFRGDIPRGTNSHMEQHTTEAA